MFHCRLPDATPADLIPQRVDNNSPAAMMVATPYERPPGRPGENGSAASAEPRWPPSSTQLRGSNQWSTAADVPWVPYEAHAPQYRQAVPPQYWQPDWQPSHPEPSTSFADLPNLAEPSSPPNPTRSTDEAYSLAPRQLSYSNGWDAGPNYGHQSAAPSQQSSYRRASAEPSESTLASPSGYIYSTVAAAPLPQRPNMARRQTTHLTGAPSEQPFLHSPQPRWPLHHQSTLLQGIPRISDVSPGAGASIPLPQQAPMFGGFNHHQPHASASTRLLVPHAQHGRSRSWDSSRSYQEASDWPEGSVDHGGAPDRLRPSTQDERIVVGDWSPSLSDDHSPGISPSSRQPSWNHHSQQYLANSLPANPSAMDFGSLSPPLPTLPALPRLPAIEVKHKGRSKRVHKPKKRLHEVPEEDKKHVCDLCDGRVAFSRPSALRTHLLTHTRARNHVCPCCNRGFTILSNLTRHIKLYNEKAAKAFEIGGEAGAQRIEEEHRNLWEKVELEKARESKTRKPGRGELEEMPLRAGGARRGLEYDDDDDDEYRE